MQNILFWLSLSPLLFLGCWFAFGLASLTVDPLALIQTYSGVSIDVAELIILGVCGLACVCAYCAAP
jgi:hypothetical protein